MSYSYTTTETFTLTNAKRLAAKVTADMHQSHRLYGAPSLADIEEYQQELTVMLNDGYLKTYEFGFKDGNGNRQLSWLYTVGPTGDLEGGRSGGLYPSAEVNSSRSFNYITRTSEWHGLSDAEREQVNGRHPVQRTSGDAPQDGNGYWENTKSYNSGGVAVTRKEFRPYGN